MQNFNEEKFDEFPRFDSYHLIFTLITFYVLFRENFIHQNAQSSDRSKFSLTNIGTMRYIIIIILND